MYINICAFFKKSKSVKHTNGINNKTPYVKKMSSVKEP